MKKKTSIKTQYSADARRLLIYLLLLQGSAVDDDERGSSIEDLRKELERSNNPYLDSSNVETEYAEKPSARTVARDLSAIKKAIKELELKRNIVDIPLELKYNHSTKRYYFELEEDEEYYED